jgi:undecaprenyl diphosphate synthase
MPSSADDLRKKIDLTQLPAHVAIIMDGNGRWAEKRKLPRLWGHRTGAKSVREIVEAAGQLGIKILTLYAFSTENWARPKGEVDGLMKLLKQTLRSEQNRLHKNNVRMETIGDVSRLPSDVQDQLEKSIQALRGNTGLRLILALNYGGRQDIIQASNRLLSEGHTEVTEALMSSHLQTASMPDPDLLIRTSGEHRISNFLLWQIAYTEIYITPVHWPDFRKPQFFQAVIDYQSRDRRFGGL